MSEVISSSPETRLDPETRQAIVDIRTHFAGTSIEKYLDIPKWAEPTRSDIEGMQWRINSLFQIIRLPAKPIDITGKIDSDTLAGLRVIIEWKIDLEKARKDLGNEVAENKKPLDIDLEKLKNSEEFSKYAQIGSDTFRNGPTTREWIFLPIKIINALLTIFYRFGTPLYSAKSLLVGFLRQLTNKIVQKEAIPGPEALGQEAVRYAVGVIKQPINAVTNMVRMADNTAYAVMSIMGTSKMDMIQPKDGWMFSIGGIPLMSYPLSQENNPMYEADEKWKPVIKNGQPQIVGVKNSIYIMKAETRSIEHKDNKIIVTFNNGKVNIYEIIPDSTNSPADETGTSLNTQKVEEAKEIIWLLDKKEQETLDLIAKSYNVSETV
jgi:hypothetical protein